MVKAKPAPFSTIIAALLDDQTPFPPRYLHRLSDLHEKDAHSLSQAWPKISSTRRVALMEDLEELNQADDLLSFEEVCKLAIKDPQPHARLLAVKILHDYELIHFIPDFIRMAKQDGDIGVRAAAVSALGAFIYLGEVDKIRQSTLSRVEEALFGILHGQDESPVRRKALEALGYCSHEEVTPAIEQAYTTNDPEWLISALTAMGRSADNNWNSSVVAMLDHQHPLVRAEAANAAGDLEIKSALPSLLKMLDDPDLDVRMAAIWALSQIGGKGVRQALEKMLEATDDEDEANLLENALDNLDFTEDLSTIALLNIADSGEDENEFFAEDEIDDFDEEDPLS
jgi:HEAT repeat protein